MRAKASCEVIRRDVHVARDLGQRRAATGSARAMIASTSSACSSRDNASWAARAACASVEGAMRSCTERPCSGALAREAQCIGDDVRREPQRGAVVAVVARVHDAIGLVRMEEDSRVRVGQHAAPPRLIAEESTAREHQCRQLGRFLVRSAVRRARAAHVRGVDERHDGAVGERLTALTRVIAPRTSAVRCARFRKRRGAEDGRIVA